MCRRPRSCRATRRTGDAARARRQGRRHRPDRQQDRRRRPVHQGGQRGRADHGERPQQPVRLRRHHRGDRHRVRAVLDAQVESLAVAPDGLHVFAGGSFTKINGVAQKSLVKLRLSDGARITAFKGKTNARVKDLAVSGGRLYIGGTFKTVNGVTRTALAAVDPVTGALSGDVNLAFTGPRTGTVNIDHFDISPDGARLIAIGNWTYVAGLQRDQIVILNLAATPVSVTD